MATKQRGTRKTKIDAAETFMRALRKLKPDAAAVAEQMAPPLMRHLAGLVPDQLLGIVEEMGKAAAAARAGNVRACMAAMRAAVLIGETADGVLRAEMDRLQLSEEDLAASIFAPLVGLAPAVGGLAPASPFLRLVRPPEA